MFDVLIAIYMVCVHLLAGVSLWTYSPPRLIFNSHMHGITKICEGIGTIIASSYGALSRPGATDRRPVHRDNVMRQHMLHMAMGAF